MMRRMCILLMAVGVMGTAAAAPAGAAPLDGPSYSAGASAPVVGAVDTVMSDGPSVTLTGWAKAPGSTQPVEIHVYDKGPGGTVGYSGYKATMSRPDVARVYGGSAAVGYAITLPLSAGTHEVCAYGIGRTSSSLLGCRSISAPPPFGAIDSYQDVVTTTNPVVEFAGWATDPALRSAALAIHVYDYAPDGQVTASAFSSTVARPDVAATFGTGPTPGFAVTAPVSVTQGNHQVCLYAISATGGENGVLGCRTVAVYPAVLGALDVAVPAAVGAAGLIGWAVDPFDPTAPVSVRFTGGLTPEGGLVAELPRPDVAAALPGAGENHGFITIQGVGLGSSDICAVTDADGDVVGCGTVVMENELGVFDTAVAADGSIGISGWTLDPYYGDQAGNTEMVIEIVGEGETEPQILEVTTDEERADVNDAFGITGTYGFTLAIGDGELAPGDYTINAWAPFLYVVTSENPGAGVPFASVQVTVN